MTAAELEKLLAEVTPGPWWTDAKYCGIEMGCAIIAAITDSGPLPGNPTRGMVAWSSAILNTEARRCEANARLIAMAPALARRVIAAEKLAEALRHCLGTITCGMDGIWSHTAPRPADMARKALAAWEAAQ